MRYIWYFPKSANCLSPCSIKCIQIVAIIHISTFDTNIYSHNKSYKVDKVTLSQCENSDNKLFNLIFLLVIDYLSIITFS